MIYDVLLNMKPCSSVYSRYSELSLTCCIKVITNSIIIINIVLLVLVLILDEV